jgi:hypothetical protein
MCGTCPKCLICHDLIALIIFVEEHILWSSSLWFSFLDSGFLGYGYSSVCGYYCFRGTFCFQLQGLKMEVAGYSKTLVTTHGVISSEDHNLNFHYCENLRSHYSFSSSYFFPPWSHYSQHCVVKSHLDHILTLWLGAKFYTHIQLNLHLRFLWGAMDLKTKL